MERERQRIVEPGERHGKVRVDQVIEQDTDAHRRSGGIRLRGDVPERRHRAEEITLGTRLLELRVTGVKAPASGNDLDPGGPADRQRGGGASTS